MGLLHTCGVILTLTLHVSWAQSRRARVDEAAANVPSDLVTEIHCLKTDTQARFSSILRLPPGHSAPPVLEEVPAPQQSTGCQISATTLDNVFLVDLDRLEECGVRECEEQGETWLCLLVRYPVLRGLRLPEDEIINIKCKPQDRAVAGQNAINFQEAMANHPSVRTNGPWPRTSRVEQKSPAIFSGGGHEFKSEIGLFRQLAGTQLFAARVQSGSQIELGENVQLRSIVRPGDGWNYSKLTDVIIQRVHDGKPLNTPESQVKLVYTDGCRDPAYSTLAPSSPWRQDVNALVNNFDFRVFMFEDMQSGDSIVITAKVVACVEEIDCRTECYNEVDNNGVRKKRNVPDVNLGKTEGWEENMELKVTLPDDRKMTSSPDPSECRLFLIVTLATALTFCLLSACIVLFACYRRYSESRRKTKTQDRDTGSIKSNSSAGFKSRSSSEEQQSALQAGALYFVPYCNPGAGSAAASGSGINNKPVTVRSVKRRDRSKSVERERRMRQDTMMETGDGVKESRPVMV